jgi:hypothetical protein
MSSGWTEVNTELSPPMNISTLMGTKGSFAATWAPVTPMVNGTIDNTTVWCISTPGANGDGGLNQYFDTKT